MPEYPKIRIYRRYRDWATNVQSWQYLASTTESASPSRALEAAAAYFRKPAETLRAEYAHTHGYYIED